MTDHVLWQRVFKNIFCFCYLKVFDTIPSRCPKTGGYPGGGGGGYTPKKALKVCAGFPRVGFLRRFGLKTGIDFPHFGLESDMVFKGATGLYELFIVSIPNE